jgi:hypothetical protein
MQLGIGQYSSPVTVTIDSGSGIIDFGCLPQTGVPNTCSTPAIRGQLYQAEPATTLSSCTGQQVEGGCTVSGKDWSVCKWQYLVS